MHKQVQEQVPIFLYDFSVSMYSLTAGFTGPVATAFLRPPIWTEKYAPKMEVFLK